MTPLYAIRHFLRNSEGLVASLLSGLGTLQHQNSLLVLKPFSNRIRAEVPSSGQFSNRPVGSLYMFLFEGPTRIDHASKARDIGLIKNVLFREDLSVIPHQNIVQRV